MSMRVLALAVFAVMSIGLFITETASAAVAVPDGNVGAGSCGRGAGDHASPVDPAYCSWDESGTIAPVIGPNSCMVAGSCVELGGGVTINKDGDPSQPGSCNGLSACELAGGNGGSSSIGNGSCNGAVTCLISGRNGGSSSVGDGSCNGGLTCEGAGRDGGNSTIGNNSCRGNQSCGGVGIGASIIIGDGSCQISHACTSAGNSAISSIGDDSCNGGVACAALAGDVGKTSCIGGWACLSLAGSVDESSCIGELACDNFTGDIGRFSCRYNNAGNAGAFNSQCAAPAAQNVGDCMYNAVVPAPCTAYCGGVFGVSDTGSVFDFTEACAAQAECASEASSGWELYGCNRTFYSEMQASCAEMWPSSFDRGRWQCLGVARLYYYGAYLAQPELG